KRPRDGNAAFAVAPSCPVGTAQTRGGRGFWRHGSAPSATNFLAGGGVPPSSPRRRSRRAGRLATRSIFRSRHRPRIERPARQLPGLAAPESQATRERRLEIE